DGLVLTPKSETAPIGETRTFTATVTDHGTPVEGVLVRASQPSGPNCIFCFSGNTAVTDADGHASFTYRGDHAGTDTLAAFADTNLSNNQEADEPGDTATKRWITDPATAVTLAVETAKTVVIGTDQCLGGRATTDSGVAGDKLV